MALYISKLCRILTQKNGVVERWNKTLMEIVRSMMGHAKLSLEFWGEAVLTASYILNQIPTKVVQLTPDKIFTGRALSYAKLRV
ncbi:hypothetical protein AMTRI_Chr10g3550 [Amborella trichopoda]